MYMLANIVGTSMVPTGRLMLSEDYWQIDGRPGEDKENAILLSRSRCSKSR